MSALISLIGIFITIFFVIGIHELAHFLTARAFGIKVERFSIGFGKVIFRWFDKKQTEYVLSLIPLGGYVKMLDEHEGYVPPEELSVAFNRQAFYKKFLVVLAGPASNLLSAIILYWIIFSFGFFTIKPIIGEVSPQSMAANAGLLAKQEIIAVDQIQTLSWTSILFKFLTHVGETDQMTVTVKSPNNQISNHTLDMRGWKIDELSPNPLSSIGITPYEPEIPLIVGVISEKSPASAQLQLGDKIISIDQHKISKWQDLIIYVKENPNKKITMTIERNGQPSTISFNIGMKRTWLLKKQGFIGIGPKFDIPKEITRKIQYGPMLALKNAIQEVWDFSYFNLLLLGKMVTGKLSIYSLGGPITIFESAGNALNYGFIAFLGFLAFLSISIGIINLLPIPGLDGGHLLFQIIEAIIRRPINDKWLLLFYRFGFILILLVLVQALLNDILRLSS